MVGPFLNNTFHDTCISYNINIYDKWYIYVQYRLCIFAYTLTLGSVPRYVSPSTPEPSTLGKSHSISVSHLYVCTRNLQNFITFHAMKWIEVNLSMVIEILQNKPYFKRKITSTPMSQSKTKLRKLVANECKWQNFQYKSPPGHFSKDYVLLRFLIRVFAIRTESFPILFRSLKTATSITGTSKEGVAALPRRRGSS